MDTKTCSALSDESALENQFWFTRCLARGKVAKYHDRHDHGDASTDETRAVQAVHEGRGDLVVEVNLQRGWKVFHRLLRRLHRTLRHANLFGRETVTEERREGSANVGAKERREHGTDDGDAHRSAEFTGGLIAGRSP